MVTIEIPQQVKQVAKKLHSTLGEECSIVLFGSVARGMANWRSDIDLLVVMPERTPRTRPLPPFHLVWETRSGFEARIERADDLALWCLLYGAVLFDDTKWFGKLRDSFRLTTWPDWRAKIDQAGKRLRIARAAREDGDLDAAEEELLMAASHLSRSLLLKERRFPLSRSEMSNQLREAGELELAALLDSLITGNLDEGAIELAESKLETWSDRLQKSAA